jgi:hypothetical protein
MLAGVQDGQGCLRPDRVGGEKGEDEDQREQAVHHGTPTPFIGGGTSIVVEVMLLSGFWSVKAPALTGL